MPSTRWLFVIVGGILVGLIFAGALWLVLRIMGVVGTPGAMHLPGYPFQRSANLFYSIS